MRHVVLLMCLMVGGSAMAQPGVIPFGVCAHLGNWEEFRDRELELALMRDAGLRWARADFTWSQIQPDAETWKWDNQDQLLDSAAKYGVTILPILCYNVDWAMPAHEHLPEWIAYVKATVSRYGDRVRYWEIWNEPNISFWKPEPNAAQYTTLLKASYKAIKEVNPDLQVVYAGLAGVPLKYLEDTLKLGAAEAFDVLALHPYHYPAAPEGSKTAEELAAARDLLTQYGSHAPIWSTEQGWPTHLSRSGAFASSVIARAASLRFPQRTSVDAAVLSVPTMPGSSGAADSVLAALSTRPGYTARLVGLDDLAALDPATTQVLVLTGGEHFAVDGYPAMLDFVRRGGLLAHFDGVPFYYAEQQAADGQWKQTPLSSKVGREPLHVGWKAWWIDKDLPQSVDRNVPVEGAGDGLEVPEKVPSTRWLTDANLKGNDRFVPLIAAYEGDKLTGYPAAVYLYDSELKGGFVSTIMGVDARGISEEQQGIYMPRAALCTLAAGLTNYFWYEFRDGGDDPYYNEHRFGLVHRDLSPKPAYHAYAALTKALGDGRFVKQLDLGRGTWAMVFDAGDTYTVAVWRPETVHPASVQLPTGGAAVAVTDYLGRPVVAPVVGGQVTLMASPQVLYVTGLPAEP